MKEKIYTMSDNNTKIIEAVIKDENLHYMHMVLFQNESLNPHYSNANVYMTVREGKLSLSLNDGEYIVYEKNTVVNIPFNTKMNVQNHNKEVLELIVIKAPAPNSEIYTQTI
ncbi:MAG: hypothetical protein EOL97_00570 [Spirochaetia bacterium]|nr:hypothetical protein [Spirochaetia bacterium]